MLTKALKGKIHRGRVTKTKIDYPGSIGIGEDMMKAAGILPYEEVLVANVTNGERLETYVITGQRGTGQICLNGPAARRVAVGDIIIIISYASMEFEEAKSFKPVLIFPDTDSNKLN